MNFLHSGEGGDRGEDKLAVTRTNIDVEVGRLSSLCSVRANVLGTT
ncbi:MAG: hypothetical protein ACRC6M_14815 [Microcystaceae cyanobacterium]